MAALIKHVMSKNNVTLFMFENVYLLQCRMFSKKFKQKREKVEVPACRKLQSTKDSIASKGFLRCQKNYQPPDDLEITLQNIVNSVLGSTKFDFHNFESEKFLVLNACHTTFNHSVPNSILHQIRNYDDLINFYSTPVDTVLPLEKLKESNLPPNLHIQYEPLRFHPDEDTMFGGQTAFPKSNTLVTGIRTRKKFKGAIVTNPSECRHEVFLFSRVID